MAPGWGLILMYEEMALFIDVPYDRIRIYIYLYIYGTV